MQLHYRCLFIDDTRELTVPYDLREQEKEGTLNMEWEVVRSLYDVVHSPVMEERFHVVCFDYYLNASGTQTGMDAIMEIYHEYKERGWDLPMASFHSSDPGKNMDMAKQWHEFGGPFVDKDFGERIKNLVESKRNPARSGMGVSSLNTSVFGQPVKRSFGIRNKGKGLRKKGGRP